MIRWYYDRLLGKVVFFMVLLIEIVNFFDLEGVILYFDY